MEYTMTNPCKNCPFRTDHPIPLRPGRIRQIVMTLDRGEFPCHETTELSEVDVDEEPQLLNEDEALHCAGALIYLEHCGQSSQMMRIAERVGLYDRKKLNMDAPVAKSESELYASQDRAYKAQFDRKKKRCVKPAKRVKPPRSKKQESEPCPRPNNARKKPRSERSNSKPASKRSSKRPRKR